MMMKTYCSLVDRGRSRAIKFVNSPRMKRGLRIESKSSDMTLTALSARFETGIEEVVIGRLLQYGI